MSERAVSFLKAWIDGVAVTGQTFRSRAQAESAAQICQDVAGESGISRDDLAAAAHGDLAGYLLDALRRREDADAIKRDPTCR